jgi:hypothetical protein
MVNFSDSNMVVASCGSVFISILRQPLNLTAVRELQRQTIAHARAHAGSYAALSIVELAAAVAQSKEVRDASSEIGAGLDVRNAAIVIQGTGFRGAAARAALRGIYLVKPPKYTYKIFDDTKQGAEWLIAEDRRAGHRAVSVEDLLAALEAAHNS